MYVLHCFNDESADEDSQVRIVMFLKKVAFLRGDKCFFQTQTQYIVSTACMLSVYSKDKLHRKKSKTHF